MLTKCMVTIDLTRKDFFPIGATCPIEEGGGVVGSQSHVIVTWDGGDVLVIYIQNWSPRKEGRRKKQMENWFPYLAYK